MLIQIADIRARLMRSRHQVGLDILSQPPEDYATFRELTGYARGLLEAANLIEDVLKMGDEL